MNSELNCQYEQQHTLQTLANMCSMPDEFILDDTSQNIINNTTISVSEKQFVDHSNDKCVLITLCIGPKNTYGKPLIKNEKKPWSKQPSEIKRSNTTTTCI